MKLPRRQFLKLSLASTASASSSLLLSHCQHNEPSQILHWPFLTFNTETKVSLLKPPNLSDATLKKIQTYCTNELIRLEKIFTLYSSDSTLCQLNQTGTLRNPPAELVATLQLASRLHEKSNGLFDPTIQSYWRWMKEQSDQGLTPSAEARQHALQKVDFSKIHFSKAQISLPPGVQLTLNSIAQGYLTDCITDLLQNEGLSNALINIGEYRAIGSPDLRDQNTPWLVKLKGPHTENTPPVPLHNQALAVSSGSGHRFTATSRDNHLLRTDNGLSPDPAETITVLAPTAALADGLATTAALMSQANAHELLAEYFPEAQLQIYSAKGS